MCLQLIIKVAIETDYKYKQQWMKGLILQNTNGQSLSVKKRADNNKNHKITWNATGLNNLIDNRISIFVHFTFFGCVF